MKKSLILVLFLATYTQTSEKGYSVLRLSPSSVGLDEYPKRKKVSIVDLDEGPERIKAYLFDKFSYERPNLDFDLDVVNEFKDNNVFRQTACVRELSRKNKQWGTSRGMSTAEVEAYLKRLIELSVVTKELDIAGYTVE